MQAISRSLTGPGSFNNRCQSRLFRGPAYRRNRRFDMGDGSKQVREAFAQGFRLLNSYSRLLRQPFRFNTPELSYKIHPSTQVLVDLLELRHARSGRNGSGSFFRAIDIARDEKPGAVRLVRQKFPPGLANVSCQRSYRPSSDYGSSPEFSVSSAHRVACILLEVTPCPRLTFLTACTSFSPCATTARLQFRASKQPQGEQSPGSPRSAKGESGARNSRTA